MLVSDEVLMGRLVAALKAHGYSITSQRMTIFRALAQRRDHPTAEALYEQLRKEVPDLSLATVYKSLHVFEKVGLARVVSDHEGRSRFDVPWEPHHHLHCTRCGTIVDVTEGVQVEVSQHLVEETGFRVTDVELMVHGLCPRCQQESFPSCC